MKLERGVIVKVDNDNNTVSVTILTETDGFVGHAEIVENVRGAYKRAFNAARCYLTLALFANVE